MSANAALLMLLFANCLLFSPVQFENWLWGFQACMALPLALVAACVAAAVSRLRVEFKFLLCIVFCACASLSLINGMASWVVVLPALVVLCAEELKGRRYLIGVWIAAFVLFSAAYAWNYARPANHSNLTLNIENSMAAIAFFLVLLSAPLTVEFVHLGTAIPIAAGAVICAPLAITACAWSIGIQHHSLCIRIDC